MDADARASYVGMRPKAPAHLRWRTAVSMPLSFEPASTCPRPRVVVADDYPPFLERVSALLAREFTVVGTASDGAALVAAEAELHPDVIVADLSMPVMSGLEAAAQIRRRGSQVPIVCVTAHREPELVDAAFAAGALGYVTKTCLAQDLLPAVRAALTGVPYVSALEAPRQ